MASSPCSPTPQCESLSRASQIIYPGLHGLLAKGGFTTKEEMAEIALQNYRPLWDKGSSAEPFNKFLQRQMEGDEYLCHRFQVPQFPRSPTFSSYILFWTQCTALYGGIAEPLSLRPLLTVISETSIFGSRILLCWLNAHMQVQKEKHELKIIHFFLNIRKIRKRNRFSSENKHIGDFIKTTLAPQQLRSAVCKVAWGKAWPPFKGNWSWTAWLESGHTVCVWPRSEPRSLNHWVKWYKCLCLRLQQDEGGFANSSVLL